MKEAKRLSTLNKAIDIFKPAMVMFQQENGAYKFQVAASIVFHKAVDPTAVTHPPVVLTSEMVAVYTDAARPLVDLNRQLLNFREVSEWFRLGVFELCLPSVNIVAPCPIAS